MDFELTEDQKMLRTMVRDFAEKELEPVAAEIDEESRFPAENVKKMGELGLFGLIFPEEYGGGGGGEVEAAIAGEEIARVCASTATILLAAESLAGYSIYKFGNEEQKKRFIRPLATGETLACFALTEAGAGSDAGAVETTATRKDNGYVLNGNKLFITNGNEAGIVVVFATVDKSLGHRGIACFVVEKGTPGLSVGKLEHKLGIRASSTAELVFENCFVPEENRIGEEGKGLRIALSAIDNSRICVAAQAVGIAQGALDKAVTYAKERQQFSQSISDFQAIQWFLADMATQIEAARLLTYQAAYLSDKGLPCIKEAAMAKVFAADTAMFVTTKAIQIYGGYGYVKDYPLERYFRDAKITGIYEGTDEMQRMTIARQLLR
jgi:butyryl-CoA dehydrogenase